MEDRSGRSILIPAIVAGLWLGAVFAVGFQTVRATMRDTGRRTAGPVWRSATNLVGSVRADLLGHLWHKDEFLDANGGWTRLLGRKVCNGVLKLRNGHLSGPIPYCDSSPQAAAIDALSGLCGELGIKSLFVLIPGRIDPDGAIVPRGAPSDGTARISDEIVSGLRTMPVLDLRPAIASSVEDVTKHFFKTDSHWNFDGAFTAFPLIARRILEELGIPSEGIPALDPSNWERLEMDRPYLGSLARRTGPFFAGTDSLFYYVPRFETAMMCRIPHGNSWFGCGTFGDALIWPIAFEKQKSHYADMGYNVYGSNRPLVRIVNASAPVRKRILLSKDSFAIPVYAFLSTVFSEVVAVDLRLWHDMTLGQYVRIMRPDVVCVMNNPGSFSKNPFSILRTEKLFDYGIPGSDPEDSVVRFAFREGSDVSIAPRPGIQYNHVEIGSNLPPGAVVTASISGARVSAGASATASVALYEAFSRTMVLRDSFLLAENLPQTVCFKVPPGNGDYRLLLYAGEFGKTADIGVVFRGVTGEVRLVRDGAGSHEGRRIVSGGPGETKSGS